MSVIYIDCDGPLSCLVGASRPYLPSDWVPAPQWDFFSNLPREETDRVKSIWRQPGFARRVPVVEGAVESIRYLREQARSRLIQIQILTTPLPRAPYWKEDRLWWLHPHFGFDPCEVVFAQDKRPHPGATLLDDHPENCEGWARAQGKRAWLFDSQNILPTHPHRVCGWGPDTVRILLEETRPVRPGGVRAGLTRSRSERPAGAEGPLGPGPNGASTGS